MKQEQLQTMLTEVYNDNCPSEEHDGDDQQMIEEYLDDDYDVCIEIEDEPDLIEVITLPSVRNLPVSADNDAIIRLIDEIEEKNHMILEYSNPPTRKKRRKVSKLELHKSEKQKSEFQPVTRTEELKYEKQTPKLIMSPSDSSANNNAGIVIYSSDKSCATCGQEFSSDFQLKRHQLSSHPLEDSIVCCDQVFKFHGEYKKHQSSDHPKSIECSYCGKILKSKKTYLVHKRSHQSILDRKFKCSYPSCSKAFNFKLHLDNHERTHSGKVISFKM